MGIMAWESLKQGLLVELEQRIEDRADAATREPLRRLAAVFYRRFPAEDMRGRSSDNLYGCAHALLHFMQTFERDEPKVRIFNPQLVRHGWESKATVLVALCRDMPFSTASVRGEINQRQLRIHTLTSCNIATRRDAEGQLLELLGPCQGATPTTRQRQAAPSRRGPLPMTSRMKAFSTSNLGVTAIRRSSSSCAAGE